MKQRETFWVRRPPDGEPMRASDLSYAMTLGLVPCAPPAGEQAPILVVSPISADEPIDGEDVGVHAVDPNDNSGAIRGAPDLLIPDADSSSTDAEPSRRRGRPTNAERDRRIAESASKQ